MLQPEYQAVFQFLTKKFEKGVKAATLNTYRSALSFILGERISRNQWILRLLKGFANFRPAKPKYAHIYDLEPVLCKIH